MDEDVRGLTVVLDSGRRATVRHGGTLFVLRARAAFTEPPMPSLPNTYASATAEGEPSPAVDEPPDRSASKQLAEDLAAALEGASRSSGPVKLDVLDDHLDLDALAPLIERAREQGVLVELHVAGR